MEIGMNLQEISGRQYLSELAVELEVCRKAWTDPHHAFAMIGALRITPIADSARKELIIGILANPQMNAADKADFCFKIIRDIQSKEVQEKVAKKMHDRFDSPEAKDAVKRHFAFGAAEIKAKETEALDQQALDALILTKDRRVRTELLAAIRTPSKRDEALQHVKDKKLLGADSTAVSETLEQVKTTCKGLADIQDYTALEVKKLLSLTKVFFRVLATMQMSGSIIELARTCKQKGIFSHGIENGLEKAAIILAHLDKNGAQEIRQLITIPTRLQKVDQKMG